MSAKSVAIRPVDAQRLKRNATIAAVSVALILVAIKFAAWLVTDSVALLSSLVDSALDTTASLLNMLAVYIASQPADHEHRFGHGKAESLAGIGQTLVIGASGALLLFEAVPRLLDPQPVEQAEVGIYVMLISIVLTLALVRYQRYVVRRTNSVAISADSLHYASDLLMNISIIVSLLLSKLLGWHVLDPIFAIGIACYVLYTAFRIVRASVDILMDRELPDEDRERIRQICLGNPAVKGVHDIRTRSSGNALFIQLHLELDGEMTLRRAHMISEQVEFAIHAAFPDAEVLIHKDVAP